MAVNLLWLSRGSWGTFSFQREIPPSRKLTAPRERRQHPHLLSLTPICQHESKDWTSRAVCQVSASPLSVCQDSESLCSSLWNLPEGVRRSTSLTLKRNLQTRVFKSFYTEPVVVLSHLLRLVFYPRSSLIVLLWVHVSLLLWQNFMRTVCEICPSDLL